MSVILASAPIVVILTGMVLLKWSAMAAGAAGLGVTLAVALFGFGYGDDRLADYGQGLAVAGALAEAVFIAATVVWIVFPALCIHELQVRSGAFDVLRAALGRITADRRILALLVAWFFALFIEGAAGFGTPIALAAPLLVSLGFRPVEALTLVLIGHAAGVSFGAVGTPVMPQLAATGLAATDLATATALLHALLGWILLAFVVGIASPAGSSPREVLGFAVFAGAAFLGPSLLIAWAVGPELPTLGGALVGGVAFAAVVARRGVGGEGPFPVRDLLLAGAPYLALVALILLTRLVPPLTEAARSVSLDWTLGETFRGAVQPLYHPGTMLFAGFLVGGLLKRDRWTALSDAARLAAGRLPPVIIALVAMLSVARLMVHAGMVDALAEGAAGGLGPVWPLVAPLVGVLGTFVTGSATASNILFTDFQAATATALGLPLLWLVAAQGFGAAVGNIVCPHNIVAGAATVGLVKGEGEVLRRTLLACACYAAAGGALVFAIVSF